MARPYPQPMHDGPRKTADTNDWQALRSELVELLEHVEGRYVREPAREDAPAGRRAPGARADDGDDRRREALKSVKRAVDRFSERDEPVRNPQNPREALEAAIGEIRSRQSERAQSPAPGQSSAASDGARFSDLARSIAGISGRMERIEVELGARRHDAAALADIGEQVRQVSHVVELLAGAVGETGQVKRLESQIASLATLIADGQRVDVDALTHRLDDVTATVERLADLQIEHVARTKEDKGLEARLSEVSANVDRLIQLQAEHADLEREASRNEDVDREKLGVRLSDVSASVERLLEAQTMQMKLVTTIPAQQDAAIAGMEAIETSVRNVYDRIDAVERSMATPSADFERLTRDMAHFTKAMQEASNPQGLLQLVDALNSRVSDLEAADGVMGGLREELAGLRNAVVGAIEPRMAAMETRLEAIGRQGEGLSEFGPRMAAIHDQLEALNERVAERPAGDPSFGQIEAQVRQLVARMDQTGEQLSGLARLYAETDARDEAPDYDAIADLVAERTSTALRANPEPSAPAGMSADDFAEIESRMSRLLNAIDLDAPAPDLSGVNEGIRRVDARLERLELALNRLAEETAGQGSQMTAEAAPAMPPAPEPPQASWMQSSPAPAALAPPPPFESRNSATQSDDPAPTMSAPPRRSDTMPNSPAEDRPLRDQPFPDLAPVRAALEAKTGARKAHPGLADPPPDAGDHPGAGGFDAPFAMKPAGGTPDSVRFELPPAARPPRPQSSLAEGRESFVAPPPPAPAAKRSEPQPPAAASGSTFIEAARRAAQAQRGSTRPDGAPPSLIARALARFQPGPADAAAPAAAAAPKPAKSPAAVEKKVRPPKRAVPDAPATTGATAPAPQAASAEPAQESFLSRHRKPILLAASVVALAFLTLNLISQRLQEAAPPSTVPVSAEQPAVEPAPPPPTPSGDAAMLSPQPIAATDAVTPVPRVIPMVDTIATGSIAQQALAGFAPASDLPPMAQAFRASAVAPDDTNEVAIAPVLDEMPPEGAGPLELRQAAANGDARAQFEIGAIYTEGRSMPRDLAIAATWYERAAAQGFAPAQYRLGNLYESGQGVPKNLEQARLWYQRAATAGNRMSMHNLAALYAGGELGSQEFESAAQWFRKAAEEGLTDSQFNLGMLYARGLGVPQDMQASYKWFALAARSGDKDAISARDDVAKSLDAAAVQAMGDDVAAWKPAPIDLAANYAPIGTWAKQFDPGEAIQTREVVLGVQTMLTRLGFDIGTPDGVAGPKTAEAIKAFERATGMSEVGAINPRLLAVLASQPA